MADVTRNDIINEVLEQLKSIKEQDSKRGKRVFENLAVITSVAVILLSILLFEYNSGFCKAYNLPSECMAIDMKMLIPFAAQICTAAVAILMYISSLKADKALGKNRFNISRVVWGEFLVIYFISKNQFTTLLGSWGGLILSYAIPILLELLINLRNKPRKNKVIPEKEHDEALETTLRDAIFHNYYVKQGIAFFVIPFVFASNFGTMTAMANQKYRTFSIDDVQYVVIVEYSDEVLAQSAEIKDDCLIIDTEEYWYFPKDGVAFSYREFENVTIMSEEVTIDATLTEPTALNDNTRPTDEKGDISSDLSTISTEKPEDETE